MTTGKRLGEILLEHEYITDAQLDKALLVQARPGEKRLLGQILISRGYVTGPQIQVALAKQKEGMPWKT